MLSNYNILIW